MSAPTDRGLVRSNLILSARTSLPGLPGCGKDRHPSSEELARIARKNGFDTPMAVPFATDPNLPVETPLGLDDPRVSALDRARLALPGAVAWAPEFRLTPDLRPTVNPSTLQDSDLVLFSRKGIPNPLGRDRFFIERQYSAMAPLPRGKTGVLDPWVDVQDMTDVDFAAAARIWSPGWGSDGVIVVRSLDFWFKKELGQPKPRGGGPSEGKRRWMEGQLPAFLEARLAELRQYRVPVMLVTNFHSFDGWTGGDGALKEDFWSIATAFVTYHLDRLEASQLVTSL